MSDESFLLGLANYLRGKKKDDLEVQKNAQRGFKPEGEFETGVVNKVGFTNTMKDQLDAIQKIKNEPPENFLLFGEGNDTGPMTIDAEDVNKYGKVEDQGGFDKLMMAIANVVTPKGADQRNRLHRSINGANKTFFDLGGKALTESEQGPLQQAFSPSASEMPNEFNSSLKSGQDEADRFKQGQLNLLKRLGYGDDLLQRLYNQKDLFVPRDMPLNNGKI